MQNEHYEKLTKILRQNLDDETWIEFIIEGIRNRVESSKAFADNLQQVLETESFIEVKSLDDLLHYLDHHKARNTGPRPDGFRIPEFSDPDAQRLFDEFFDYYLKDWTRHAGLTMIDRMGLKHWALAHRRALKPEEGIKSDFATERIRVIQRAALESVYSMHRDQMIHSEGIRKWEELLKKTMPPHPDET